MQVRLFSVEQANALLPELERLFEKAGRVFSDLHEVRDHLVDLRIVWGDQIDEPSCEGYQEYQGYHTQFVQHEAELQKVLGEFRKQGCEVKDLEHGLVDFHARRGEEIVYLCWRRGEPKISAWHNQMTGYAGRRDISEF